MAVTVGIEQHYEGAAYIRQLARDHLDRDARRRFAAALGQLPVHLGRGETPIVLTDAWFRDAAGLLVVTDERLLFVPRYSTSSTWSLPFEDGEDVRATCVPFGTASDVVVRAREDEFIFESVGDETWAEEIANLIAGVTPEADGVIEKPVANVACPVCSEQLSVLSVGQPCPSCGISTANDVLSHSGRQKADDEVTYTLDDWTPPELARVEERLLRDEIPHDWTGVTLGVPRAFEDAVDSLLDEIKAALGPSSRASASHKQRAAVSTVFEGQPTSSPRYIGEAGVGQYFTVRQVVDAVCYIVTGIALFVVAAQPDVSPGWAVVLGIGAILYGLKILVIGGSYWQSYLVYFIAGMAVIGAFGGLSGG